jgi:hypothetical protein
MIDFEFRELNRNCETKFGNIFLVIFLGTPQQHNVNAYKKKNGNITLKEHHTEETIQISLKFSSNLNEIEMLNIELIHGSQ